MTSRLLEKQRKDVLRGQTLELSALRAPKNSPPVLQKDPEQEIQSLHRYIRQKLTEIEQVYQYSPVGLVLMDMDYRFVRINERMAEINGLPVEAHIGRTLREVVPDLADYIMELYRPVYERGEPVLNVELQGQTPRSPACSANGWRTSFRSDPKPVRSSASSARSSTSPNASSRKPDCGKARSASARSSKP